MNYHNITKDDMLNGDGLRVVLWVAGCNHNCKGCQNPQTHDVKSGIEFTTETIDEIVEELKKPYIQGLTLSGGDPLHPENRNTITRLCNVVKCIFGETKDIWCYTGYTYEQVKKLEVMKYIDVVVDGRFVEKLKDENYPWAGSTNQRVINVKESLKQDKVVLLGEE